MDLHLYGFLSVENEKKFNEGLNNQCDFKEIEDFLKVELPLAITHYPIRYPSDDAMFYLESRNDEAKKDLVRGVKLQYFIEKTLDTRAPYFRSYKYKKFLGEILSAYVISLYEHALTVRDFIASVTDIRDKKRAKRQRYRQNRQIRKETKAFDDDMILIENSNTC
jgi:hypothetical protein